MLELLSSKKSFDQKWIGNPTFNRLGGHLFRLNLADLALRSRRLFTGKNNTWFDQLQRDGVVAIDNFLPDDVFSSLQVEAHQLALQTETQCPFPLHKQTHGFGEKIPFDNGFDRFDGSTLNRFVELSKAITPQCYELINNPQLRQLYRQAAGCLNHPDKFYLYQMRHDESSRFRDSQKQWHRDTFHSAIKLWYFIDDVSLDDGPFEYIKGSHKMTSLRKNWEYLKSNRACQSNQQKGGAFRFNQADLRYLKTQAKTAFPVKANTLVLADVRGIHRRGAAVGSNQRLSIYASFRPHPFSVFPY